MYSAMVLKKSYIPYVIHFKFSVCSQFLFNSEYHLFAVIHLLFRFLAVIKLYIM